MIICVTIFSLCNNPFMCLCEDNIYGHGYFEYKIIDNGIVIVNYLGNEEEVSIPNSIANMPVYKIEKNAFIKGCIKVVKIPDTVTEIEDGAIGLNITIVLDYNHIDNPNNDVKNDDIPLNNNNIIYTGDNSIINSNNNSDNTISDYSNDKDLGAEIDFDSSIESKHIEISNSEENNNISKNSIEDNDEISNKEINELNLKEEQITDNKNEKLFLYISLAFAVLVMIIVVSMIFFKRKFK